MDAGPPFLRRRFVLLDAEGPRECLPVFPSPLGGANPPPNPSDGGGVGRICAFIPTERGKGGTAFSPCLFASVGVVEDEPENDLDGRRRGRGAVGMSTVGGVGAGVL